MPSLPDLKIEKVLHYLSPAEVSVNVCNNHVAMMSPLLTTAAETALYSLEGCIHCIIVYNFVEFNFLHPQRVVSSNTGQLITFCVQALTFCTIFTFIIIKKKKQQKTNYSECKCFLTCQIPV